MFNWVIFFSTSASINFSRALIIYVQLGYSEKDMLKLSLKGFLRRKGNYLTTFLRLSIVDL